MDLAKLSQFNPDNVGNFLYGDPEVFQAFNMAASNALIGELGQAGLELTTEAETMAELRTRLGIPAEIGVAITVMRAADAAEAMPDGLEFLADSPETLGFCFSAGIENDGKEILELFVALDASHYPEIADDGEPTDEQVEAILELNHYLITQLLIGLDGDESDDEPSDEAYAVLEDKANTVLEGLIDEGIPPVLALIPAMDED